MEVLSRQTDRALLASLLQELAKSSNEIKCAQRDLAKAISRQQFALVLVNELINRKGD